MLRISLHRLCFHNHQKVLLYRQYRPLPIKKLQNQYTAIKDKYNSKLIQHFSVSHVHRVPIPPHLIALFLRPVSRFFAMILGTQIRRWYLKLSEKEKEKFWSNVQKRHPITGKRKLILFNQQQMNAIANVIAEQLIQENPHAVLKPSHPHYRRALKIAMQIINANKKHDLVKDRNWFLVVVNDPRINAMVLPNGIIVVFTGLLNMANDEQVGIVLSHEIAHCLLNHHAIRLSHEYLLEILLFLPLLLVMWAVFPIPEAIFGYFLGNYFKDLVLLLPYERDQEIEADKYGLLLAANTCLDVRQAIVFWKMMEKIDVNNNIPWWLSTHPSHSKRIEYIENLMPYALKIRHQKGCPVIDKSYWSRLPFFN
ncbi:metalloendopeptidase OMA1, mitochondrial-like isoform X2 [Adelges cooleyi]|uniref:metalloendopeptidase OMA1, mitochondrial-like isoform X2 n=1 Tax=Adelges cooleyi TaxID=133065 RepID=UPI0021802D63|nr:metalloendopeptidase OMA1, mitochondrial-like isoform X2 [Adelges cooleyi]